MSASWLEKALTISEGNSFNPQTTDKHAAKKN
jgi:hypothetical protein